MSGLEREIGYTFKNKSLLACALTHSSYANEKRPGGGSSNERLEFLGDSVLGHLVAEHLFKASAKTPEGKMTRLRAELVCEQSLLLAAKALSLGGYIRLGRGEELTGGRKRPSILADAVEALIAAIYLDGGLEAARDFVRKFILSHSGGMESAAIISDYKTELQEFVQRGSGLNLSYRAVSESGPEHNKTFVYEVHLNGKAAGRGSGRSKKEAEQAAAKEALEAFDI